MKVYDLSVAVHPDMTVWEGDAPPAFNTTSTVAENGVMVSRLDIASHLGTHVDASAHFIESGKTIDEVPPEKLIGDVVVLDVSESSHQELLTEDIDWETVGDHRRVLFKTKNTVRNLMAKPEFHSDYVSVSEHLARELVDREIVLVGIDYLGVEKKSNPGHPVHTVLLENEVVVIEGLDLVDVPAGKYEFFCGPIKFSGIDGSTARVFLIDR